MRILFLTVALSMVITIALALPVLGDPSTQLFGHEIVGRHHDPFTVIEQYRSGAVPRPYLQPITDGAGIALSRMTTTLVAYNVLVLMTFPLTALTAFLHARHFVRSSVAAMIAALLFMMAPFHLAHAAYHVHIAQIQWLPLFFLTLWRLIDRPSIARGSALAGALLLVGLSSFYLGFIVSVVAPGAAVAYAWLTRDQRSTRLATAITWPLATLVLTASLVVLAIWIVSPEVIDNARVFAFPDESLDQHTARWFGYLLWPTGHPLFGAQAASLWRAAGIGTGLLEQQVSVGIGALALAAVPLIGWRGSVSASTVRGAQALAVTALIAALCSLPPRLDVASLSIPMPSTLLYAAAPMFRAYARFAVVVSLMVTTLAGIGVVLLSERRSRVAAAFLTVSLAVVAIEYFPPLPTSRDVLPTAAHRWLVTQSPDRVFDCTDTTPGNTAGVSFFMNSAVGFPAGPLDDCGDPEFAGKLAAFGFTHVIARSDNRTGKWLANGGQIAGARLVHSDPQAAVYEVAVPRPPLHTIDLSGFYPREYAGRDSWRWLGVKGTMVILNTTKQSLITTLRLDAAAYATARRIRVTVDDEDLDMIVAAPTRQPIDIGPIVFDPGTHTVRFEPDSASAPATLLAGSIDTRPLALQVFTWKWQTEPTAR